MRLKPRFEMANQIMKICYGIALRRGCPSAITPEDVRREAQKLSSVRNPRVGR
jgi:hypothetical protein